MIGPFSSLTLLLVCCAPLLCSGDLATQTEAFFVWQLSTSCAGWGSTETGLGRQSCASQFFPSSWPAATIASQYVREFIPSTSQDSALFIGGPTDTELGGSTVLMEYGTWQPQGPTVEAPATPALYQNLTQSICYAYAPNVVVAVGRAAVGASGNEFMWATGISKLESTAGVTTFGLTWTSATNAKGSVFSGMGMDVVYAPPLDLWVAVGVGANHTMAKSGDGETWTGLGNGIFASQGSAITFSRELMRFVATGREGSYNLAYSNNGTMWIGLNVSLIPPTGGAKVAWGAGASRFVLIITDVQALGWNQSIVYSSDGIVWSSAGKPFLTIQANALIYSDYLGFFVAGGLDPGAPRNVGSVIRSVDGATWRSTTSFPGAVTALSNVKPGFDLGLFAGGVNSGRVLVSVVENVLLSTASSVAKDFTLQGTLNLTSQAALSLSSNAYVGGTLILQPGASVHVSDKLVITGRKPNLVIRLPFVTLAKRATSQTTIVTIANYSTVQGSFAQTAIESPNPCVIATLDNLNYGTTSLTAVVQLTQNPSCVPVIGNSTTQQTTVAVAGLSQGAIAGIVIGCIVFAVLVVVALVLVMRQIISKRDEAMRKKIQGAELENMKQQAVSM